MRKVDYCDKIFVSVSMSLDETNRFRLRLSLSLPPSLSFRKDRIIIYFSFLFLISAKILLFYVIFYAVLAGFFGAMLTVFYQTLDPNAPKWQLDNSLIGSNPGLGFRPMPPSSNVESTLIWYKASDEGNFLHWTRELDKFLEGIK